MRRRKTKMNNNYNIRNNESDDEYIQRICQLKYENNLSWQNVADIINDTICLGLTADACRLRYKRRQEKEENKLNQIMFDNIMDSQTDSLSEMMCDIQKERVKLRDEISQNNALIRKMAREESIKEIAIEVANTLINNFPLRIPEPKIDTNTEKEALLTISDWHYGIDIKNIYNTYNPQITKERIEKLQEEVINRCIRENITCLTVANLGDMIAGNIHLPLRINSRKDVITQIIEVSELIAEFLNNLSQYLNINYYAVLDNHSRIDPNKKEAIQMESLARITTWFLKERLKNNPNIEIHDNYLDEDIMSFDILNHSILGVHGDDDKQKTIIPSLISFTEENAELIISAHMHHFSADEECGTIVCCNGSLMGTDDYAFRMRKHSKPSQNLIFITKDNVFDSFNRIIL